MDDARVVRPHHGSGRGAGAPRPCAGQMRTRVCREATAATAMPLMATSAMRALMAAVLRPPSSARASAALRGALAGGAGDGRLLVGGGHVGAVRDDVEAVARHVLQLRVVLLDRDDRARERRGSEDLVQLRVVLLLGDRGALPAGRQHLRASSGELRSGGLTYCSCASCISAAGVVLPWSVIA